MGQCPPCPQSLGLCCLFSSLDPLSILAFCDVLLPLHRGLTRALVKGRLTTPICIRLYSSGNSLSIKRHVYSAGLFFCAPSFSLISRILAASIRYLCEASVALR